jgi:hypothetical protein
MMGLLLLLLVVSMIGLTLLLEALFYSEEKL